MTERDDWARAQERFGGPVQSITLQLQGEQVLLSVREGALRVVCTCGETGCGHATEALSWVCGATDPPPERLSHERGSARSSTLGDAGPALEQVDGLVSHTRLVELANALDDVLLAVVRTGVVGAESLSVEEMLARVLEVSPRPVPHGLARWMGRLEAALRRQDIGTTARLLDGAARFSQDLRATEPSAEQLARCNAWLSNQMHVEIPREKLHDRTLLELGRERVAGLSRRSLERRYLVDLKSGEVFREERNLEQEASLGPSPRVLQVGLAEVDAAGSPRRLHLLQYAVSPVVTQQQWATLEALAVRSVGAIKEVYIQALREYPGQAEPVVVFAPCAVGPGGQPADARGQWLPLSREKQAAYARAVQSFAMHGEIAWILGRIVDSSGALWMRPVSVSVRDSATSQLRVRRVA